MFTAHPFVLVKCSPVSESSPIVTVTAWAIVVKKPESSEVAGHVPDDVARVLFPLLSSGEILSMKCAITGLSKAAEEGVWVQGGGIVIPCTYILYGKKLDRPHARQERTEEEF